MHMERLTEKRDGQNVIPLRQNGEVKWALSSAGMGDAPTQFLYGVHADKLAEYEDLEEQNKLLKLPCAVGDTVYEVQELRKRIQPYIVIAVHVSNCGNLYGWELEDGKGVYSNVNGFSEYAIGKQVFLTKEAAEAALKEMSE